MKLAKRGFHTLLLLLTAFLAVRALATPHLAYDTFTLLTGAPALWACVTRGPWGDCPTGSYFNLLQHLPAWIALGISHDVKTSWRILCAVNLAASLGTAAVGWRLLRERAPFSAVVWLLLLVASPLLFFSSDSFSEPIALFVNTALLGAVLAQAPGWACFTLAALAATAKETAPAFLLALLALGTFPAARRESRAVIAHRIAPALAGVALGTVTNLWLNFVRYGTASNLVYAKTIQWGPLKVNAAYFVAAFFSPSGGILFHWPAASLLFAGAGFAAAKGRAGAQALPAALVTLGIFAFVFSLTFSPFGWDCWGNRLILPWLPPLALFLLWQEGAWAESLARLGRARRAGIAALVGCASLPQLLVVIDRGWVDDVFRALPACPHEATDSTDYAYIQTCNLGYLWRPDATFFRIYSMLATHVWIATGAAAFVALFVLGAMAPGRVRGGD